MSSETVVRVENISKCYQIYSNPRDRLKQFLFPKIQTVTGHAPTQYFREFWALKDVSFEIGRGESIGIIGRNGSGKSTLLQIICGVVQPSTGIVETRGRIAALLELGSGFNPEFSGRDNVYMNGALLGLTGSEIDDRFDAIASFADIGEFLDQPIKTYSSGMLLRLAFAVQVQVEPDILIVDEALAVGDALFQKRCFQQIEKLLSDGTTLLFVSHDQESVRTLTNRALLLKNGRSIAWGTSSEVVLEYRRQLHDDESKYFADVAQKLTAKRIESSGQAVPGNLVRRQETASPPSSSDSLDRLSFGDGGVTVTGVETLDSEGNQCSVFYPGIPLVIRVTCQSMIDIASLNVAIRIRNKEGVKMYSWGTLNQDMRVIGIGEGTELFWNRCFGAGDNFAVEFSCECALGVNLYEIQATVSHEGTPDYVNQRILHWVDEAAFFQVMMKRDQHFFGGVTDLRMRAAW